MSDVKKSSFWVRPIIPVRFDEVVLSFLAVGLAFWMGFMTAVSLLN